MTLSINQRILLFLFGCISSRFFLSYLIKNISNKYSFILTFILLLIGIGFLTIYFFDLRKTGLETGGNPIWWNNFRPIHGIFYLIASLLLFYKNKSLSSKIIFIDTLFGLSAFLFHHINKGNIKLF